MPTASEFREQLFATFRIAEQKSLPSIVVKAGDLHRTVGGYPNRKTSTHRTPSCCDVMRSAMREGDAVVSEPQKGQGATLTIRCGFSAPRRRESAPVEDSRPLGGAILDDSANSERIRQVRIFER